MKTMYLQKRAEGLHMKLCILDIPKLESILLTSFFVSLSTTLKHCFSGEVGIRFKAFYTESNTKCCVLEIHQ